MNTIPQLPDLKKRRDQRAIQHAKFGNMSDPSIITEGEELDTVINLMDRINIHRNRLAQLLKNRSASGIYTLPHVLTEIEDERSHILELRSACQRLGYTVSVHEGDSDGAVEATTIAASSVPDMAFIRTSVKNIEGLLEEGHNIAALSVIRQLLKYLG